MPMLAFNLSLAAAVPAAESQSDWVVRILREFSRTQTTGFLWDAVKWSVLGALIGMGLAALACALFTKLGWYDLRWRFARGLRWTLFTLMGLITAVLFGLAGFGTGILRGSERVLTRSQLATDVFPRIGEAVADGMAWVQAQAEAGGTADTNALARRLESFRAGELELRAATFLQQLDEFRDETLKDWIARLETATLERAPQLKGGLGEKLLHQCLANLGRLVLEKKATSELRKYGVDRLYAAIREELIAEAARVGNAETIARRELAEFLVQRGIVPGILSPIRSTIRAQQLPLLAIAGLVLVVPPLCLRLARRRTDGSTKVAEAPPITPPASPA